MSTHGTHRWDPDVYLRHADERARPFVELLARVRAESPRRVVDLGCGPGHLTALLARRWPAASVHGLDSSSEMVDAARTEVGEGAAAPSFEVADLRSWAPAEPVDVIVSNATLQWVPGHLALLPRLFEHLSPGGWLAFQVPGNEQEPSTQLRRALAADPRFAPHLIGVADIAAHEPGDYLDALAPFVGPGGTLDVWETTYLHVLQGPDPVFDWFSATGARPMLQALPDEARTDGTGSLREQFTEELRAALRSAYPARDLGTVLPFRRVFVVARNEGGSDRRGRGAVSGPD